MIFPAFGPSLHARPCPRADVRCVGFSAVCGTLLPGAWFPVSTPSLYITPLQNGAAQSNSCARSQVWTSAGRGSPAEIHAVSMGHLEGSWDPAGKGKLLYLGQLSLLHAGSHSPASGTVFSRWRQSSTRVKSKNCHTSWGLRQELQTTSPPHSMGQDKSKASSDSQGGGRNPASLWRKSQSVCPLSSSTN